MSNIGPAVAIGTLFAGIAGFGGAIYGTSKAFGWSNENEHIGLAGISVLAGMGGVWGLATSGAMAATTPPRAAPIIAVVAGAALVGAAAGLIVQNT